MDIITLGLCAAVIIVGMFNFILGWFKYSRSIQKVIYSSYLEYWTKKNKIRKLSESVSFAENFGKHRIVYQLFSGNGQKLPQPFIIVILSTGLYYLKVSNVPGEVYGKRTGMWENVVNFDKKHSDNKTKEKLPNPLIELEQFKNKIQEKITKIQAPVYKIVVFPDQCKLKIKKEEMGDLTIINRSQLMNTLMNINKPKKQELEDWEIDAVWNMIVKDSLKLEEK